MIRYDKQGSVSGWLAEAHPYSPPRRPSLRPHWTVQPDLHNCHVEAEDDDYDCDDDHDEHKYDDNIHSEESSLKTDLQFQHDIKAVELMLWI